MMQTGLSTSLDIIEFKGLSTGGVSTLAINYRDTVVRDKSGTYFGFGRRTGGGKVEHSLYNFLVAKDIIYDPNRAVTSNMISAKYGLA